MTFVFFFDERELPEVKDLKLVCLTKCLSCEDLQVLCRNEVPDVAFIP